MYMYVMLLVHVQYMFIATNCAFGLQVSISFYDGSGGMRATFAAGTSLADAKTSFEDQAGAI